MSFNKRRLLWIHFAQASLIHARLQECLGDDYEIIRLEDNAPSIHDLQCLAEEHASIKAEALYLEDETPFFEKKTSQYKMPNADRQYLQKWQPR